MNGGVLKEQLVWLLIFTKQRTGLFLETNSPFSASAIWELQ